VWNRYQLVDSDAVEEVNDAAEAKLTSFRVRPRALLALTAGLVLAISPGARALGMIQNPRPPANKPAPKQSRTARPKESGSPSTKSANAVVEEKVSTPGVKTDYRVYAEPEPPRLPPAGETFQDPVFGTTILRVTDENDGQFNATQYSYWPSFNRDATRLFITAGSKAVLYDFDGVRLRVFNKRPLFVIDPPVGRAVTTEDAIWSASEPDVIYAHDGMRLWSYSVVNKKYTLEKDFARQLGAGYLHQMTRSMDDNVFAFTVRNRNSVKTGYAVWWRNTDALYKAETSPDFDEAQLDKTGQFLVIKTGKAGKGQVRVEILNLAAKTTEPLLDGEPDYAPGHSDNGTGFVIGGDNWKNRFNYRKLATPKQFYPVLELGNDWSIGSHVSLLADDESWMLVSTFTANELPSGGVFRNELFLVATDGSKRVRRLAHLHSLYRDYWDTPRANISRDGKFAVFTSNWRNPGRRDVFILRIPPESR
jgi:hypothetical protein